MKFLTFILAFSITFLAIEPGIESILSQTETKQSCCGGQCTPNSENNRPYEENHEDDCSGKLCNPFQVCSNCALDCNNLPIANLYKPPYLERKGFSYKFAFTSQFISDFWQPPKHV